MPLKVLIIGAGICGPALATLLRRADPDAARFEITVIERSPKLRDTGLQIDLRSQGIPVVRKMGLLDTIRTRTVPERGVSFVDARGHVFATFGKNDSGHGAQAMTSEYEIMRGDLVDVFYRASLGLDPGDKTTAEEKKAQVETGYSAGSGVRYEFGVTVTDISQNNEGKGGKVNVTFSNGKKATYDLVVAADGQSSRTRRMIFSEADTYFRSLGLFTAYFLIPRGPDDDGWMKWHVLPGKRGLFTRSGDAKAPTQVYLSVCTDRAKDAYGVAAAFGKSSTSSSSSSSSSASGAGVKAQKEAFARAFEDYDGWRVPAMVDALRHRTPDDDFYATEIGQVRAEKLVSGRVVLLGDAGYCAAPVSGMGTTLSLTGAYILAGELARNRGKDGDVEDALKSYEKKVRPYVREAQKLPPGNPWILYPQSDWGVWVFNFILWVVAKLRLLDLAFRLAPAEKGGLSVPEYPELNLDS